MFVYLLIFGNVSKITHPQQFGKGVEAIFDALKENTTLEKLMLQVSINYLVNELCFGAGQF